MLEAPRRAEVCPDRPRGSDAIHGGEEGRGTVSSIARPLPADLRPDGRYIRRALSRRGETRGSDRVARWPENVGLVAPHARQARAGVLRVAENKPPDLGQSVRR